MNESCETFEAAISALTDGELDAPEQLVSVDHLLVCPSCQAFYRRARKLGEMVAQAEAAELGPPPEEVWRRIADETGVARGRVPAVQVPRWTLQLAAVLVLALGLGLAQRFFWSQETQPPEVVGDGKIVVELGSASGTMTEDRFLEITTEILRSDSRYHREMLAVMALVTAANDASEGSVDRLPRESREGRRIDLGDETESGEGSVVFAGDRL